MSIMGTGIAAGVAQSAHTAQKVAREQDKKHRESASASREMRDRYEHLIQDIEESEDASTAARLAVDDQVPDHEQSKLPPESSQQNEEEAPSPLTGLAMQHEAAALRQKLTQSTGADLFRHLDLEA